MEKIVSSLTLANETAEGVPLRATFHPGKGMNLMSYTQGPVEVIDQQTRPLFEERGAGLGAMIGPHFHHRNEGVIPPVPHEERFAHIAAIRAKGGKEPFSHGIGRYAPWKVERQTERTIEAVLSGSDTWHEVPLKVLEGQDFEMRYKAHLKPEGLEIDLSVESETDSVVGLHTYYALAEGKGVVRARVRDHYNDQGELKPIDSSWNYNGDHTLIYPVDRPTDFGFAPYPDPLHGEIEMETATHHLKVAYWCANEENSWQMWHPEGASFVCIEPLSARDPRKPKLSASSLKILISVH